MSDKKFERFGKYLILDHLVDGGMAKICRARYLGEQANKVVAIKMVQPQFSNDEAFVRMFQDELKITFGMLHPNIMQVYDYGKVDGQLYTAMEYIHGANLKQYLDRLKERKVVFPVEISCYIISQVCLGLHYAHTFTDKLTGKPYNIVHRDISPHNIMLTYDGAVKVIDFGIAKANTNSEATQAGTIKGKLSYLAPEYLDGLELDARYDEFAVGISLWEMLCSRRLFQANNDLAVLKLIQQCKITPPSEINPAVPKELDAIVLKALSKDRAKRYENLDQLNRALVRFLYSNYPDFNASDLKMFADDLFKQEIMRDQEKFVEYGSIDIQPYIEDMKRDESKTGRTGKKSTGESEDPAREEIREIELNIDANPSMNIEIEKVQKKTSSEKTVTRKLSKESLQQLKNSSKNGKQVPAGPSLKKNASREKTNSRVVVSRKDINAKAASAERSSGKGLFTGGLVASALALLYFQGEMIGIDLQSMIHGEVPARAISSVKKGPGKRAGVTSKLKNTDAGEGKVILGGLDFSMEVFINGRRAEYVGKPIMIPIDEEVTLTIKKKGHIPFITKVMLTKDKNSTVVNVPRLERARMGLLTTSLNYTAGSMLVYEEAGEVIERQLPFKDMQIPAGTYHAKVVNPILGTEKNVEFVIEENKKHFLE